MEKQKFLENLEDKKCIAIVGLCKNAGKTTLLNWLMKNLNSENLAIITTGRDGEDNDLVEGHKKPKVFLKKNSFYTTLAHEIKNQSSHIEVISKLKQKATGKNLWLVKTINDIEGETVGPAAVSNQVELIKLLSNNYADKVIVDGALDRKSIALSNKIDAIILVASPAYGNKEEIINELKRLHKIWQIPIIENTKHSDFISFLEPNMEFSHKMIFGNESWLEEHIKQYNPQQISIPGALTEMSFEKIKSLINKYDCQWIFRHGLQLHLSETKLNQLLKTNKIFASNRFNLFGVVTNSFSHQNRHILCDSLLEHVRLLWKELPVIDVKELE